MSENDILGDAVERLEWDERKVDDSPMKKAGPAHAPHRPDRRCGRSRGGCARGVRRLEQAR